MKPLRRRDPNPLPRENDKRIREGGMQVVKRDPDQFTGWITAPYLKGQQVPTNTKVRNPETGQFEDRQMEPEEIADYIFKNQVRREPRRMMTREQAYQKAMEIRDLDHKKRACAPFVFTTPYYRRLVRCPRSGTRCRGSVESDG